MNRSLYPDSVEVHQRHLENTELTKSEAIKSSVVRHGSCGVYSGLTVTPNSTYVNISSGNGYAPNGELLILQSGLNNVALASYVLGAKNYIALVYDEVYSSPESHETDGTVRNTKATVSPRLAVLTESQWNALPLTDSVLLNNARDRALLLAIVTANGAGVSLTSDSIASPTTFDNVIQVSQPVLITGVSATSVDPTTTVGTGTLLYTVATKEIKWKAPGDLNYGAGQILSTSGNIVLISDSGKYIAILVQYSQLPASGVTVTDLLTVSNLYGQTVTRLTNIDSHHRSMVGSGIPTATNPHGLTLQDIDTTASSSIETHQDVEHANGIAPGSASDLLSATVNASGVDKLTFVNFASGDSIYINGKLVNSLVVAPQIEFVDGTAECALYGAYITQNRTLYKSVRAKYPAVSLLSGKAQIINCSDNIGSATKDLVWSKDGAVNTIQFDGGPVVNISVSVDTTVRLYSSDVHSWIDVYVKTGTVAPVAPETDTITFFSEPDLDGHLPLLYTFWSGAATAFLGYGFGAANTPNGLIDRRTFGNTAEDNISSDSTLISSAMMEALFGNGLVPVCRGQSFSDQYIRVTPYQASQQQFTITTVAAGSAEFTGGVAFIAGKFIDVMNTTLSFTPGVVNRVYIDSLGAVKVTHTVLWDAISATELHNPMVRICAIEVDGAGTESFRTDRREWICFKKDSTLGVPKLGNDGELVVTDVGTGANASIRGIASTGKTGVHGEAIAGDGVLGTSSSGSAVKGDASGDATGASIGGEFIGSTNGKAIDATATGATGVGVNVTSAGIGVKVDSCGSYAFRSEDVNGAVSLAGGNIETGAGNISTSSGTVSCTGNITSSAGAFVGVNAAKAFGTIKIVHDAVTPTIEYLNSYNIGAVSITDATTGQFKVTLSTPMPSAGYVIIPFDAGGYLHIVKLWTRYADYFEFRLWDLGASGYVNFTSGAGSQNVNVVVF